MRFDIRAVNACLQVASLPAADSKRTDADTVFAEELFHELRKMQGFILITCRSAGGVQASTSGMAGTRGTLSRAQAARWATHGRIADQGQRAFHPSRNPSTEWHRRRKCHRWLKWYRRRNLTSNSSRISGRMKPLGAFRPAVWVVCAVRAARQAALLRELRPERVLSKQEA